MSWLILCPHIIRKCEYPLSSWRGKLFVCTIRRMCLGLGNLFQYLPCNRGNPFPKRKYWLIEWLIDLLINWLIELMKSYRDNVWRWMWSHLSAYELIRKMIIFLYSQILNDFYTTLTKFWNCFYVWKEIW